MGEGNVCKHAGRWADGAFFRSNAVCVDDLEVITLPFYMTSDNSCTYFGHFSMLHAWMSLFYSLLLDTYPSLLLVTGETSLEASCASHRCCVGGLGHVVDGTQGREHGTWESCACVLCDVTVHPRLDSILASPVLHPLFSVL